MSYVGNILLRFGNLKQKQVLTHLTPYKEGKFTYYALDQVKRFLKQYYKHSANCNILIQKVIDYCIPVQKIKTTDLNQKIVPEITEMLTYRYSHIYPRIQ